MNTTDHTRMQRVVLLFCALLVAGAVMGCGKGSTLEDLGATIERDDQGEIVGVDLYGTQISDAGVADLQKALPKRSIA